MVFYSLNYHVLVHKILDKRAMLKKKREKVSKIKKKIVNEYVFTTYFDRQSFPYSLVII